jgi:hypothetical protein
MASGPKLMFLLCPHLLDWRGWDGFRSFNGQTETPVGDSLELSKVVIPPSHHYALAPLAMPASLMCLCS